MKGEVKMRKRWVSIMLTMAMAATALAGCVGKQTNGEETTAGSERTEDESGVSGSTDLPELPNNTLKISVSIPTFGTDPKDTAVQQEWQKKMEKYLGCTLDITWNYTPWLDYRENEKVLLASGDLPDVFTYSQGDAINEYGEDGQVLDIAQYTQYMPNYMKFVEETQGGENFAFNQDGTSYFFKDAFVNMDNIIGAQSFTGFVYRFDVLKENNLKPATTLEEFTELCAQLKELYPDAYVMSNTDKNYAFYRGFVGIFHTWDTLYWNGTEWAFGPIEDNFKEMLKYLNELYEAGYIDPEFATDDGDTCKKKAVTGKDLIFPTCWAGMATEYNRHKEDESMEFGLAYLPTNEDYGTPWKWGSKQAGRSLASTGFGIAISADVEYPEWIVKMLDYQYSDEMIELQNWGLEGETFIVNEDGSKSFTETITKADDPVQALANYGVTSSAACRTGIVFTPQDFQPQIAQLKEEPWWSEEDGYHMNKYWLASSEFGGEDSISPADRAPILNLNPDQSTEKATLITACETVAKEQALKFITGEKDFEKDWDTYVKTIKAAVDDFDGILKMLNENSVQ